MIELLQPVTAENVFRNEDSGLFFLIHYRFPKRLEEGRLDEVKIFFYEHKVGGERNRLHAVFYKLNGQIETFSEEPDGRGFFFPLWAFLHSSAICDMQQL